MSASQRLQTEYLTCTQCSKPFHHPKTLPCMHNFCKACLSAYLENVMKGGRHTSFKCPDCRKKIFVPDPGKPVVRWAAQFPTNFVLSGMIEAINDEAGGQAEGGLKVKAAKERRGEVEEDSKTGDFTDSQSVKKTPVAGQGGHSQKLEEDIAQLEATLKKESSVLGRQLDAHDRQKGEEQKKLEKSFEKVQELIEFRKIQLLEELEENYVEEKDRIQQTEQSFKSDLESLGSCRELLGSLKNKSLNDEVASDMMDAIRAQMREIETRPTKVIARSVKFDQKLEAGRSILNLIDDLGSITITTAGEVSRKEGGSSVEDVDVEDSSIDPTKVKILAKPRFLTAISTRHQTGNMQQIFDITVMPSGVVVMTAYGSNVVMAAKSDGNTYKIFSSLQLDSEPKCIATISPYYVGAVGRSCVFIIAVSDSLVLKKKVQTGKEYHGIAAYSETSLILSSQSPPTVDFVGLNGFISETIDRDHTTNTMLFKNPHFITTSHEGVIYVTDASRVPRVLSLNNAGKLRFKFPDSDSAELRAPQGIACDSRGHVYVVDRGTRKVILLTPQGEKVRDLLTSEEGLTDPCSIAIDKHDILYVTNDFSEVLVFQIR